MYLLFSLLKFLSGRLGLLQEASLESLELWLALFVFDFTHVWGDALGVSSGLWRAFCQVLRVG